MFIGIIGWVVVGLAVGFVVSKVLDLHGDDPMLGIGAALGGAILFAVLYTVISGAGVSYFNLWSLMFAAIGAGVGVATWHLIRSKFVSHAPYSRRKSY
jgi:drug/metabolite transporter (DMT)-like permease